MGLEKIFSNVGHIGADILSAYYTVGGDMKTPSADELSKIEEDIASLNVVGGGLLVTSGGVLGVSWITWGIPYIGPFIGGPLGIAGLALGVLCYDAFRCSSNLQPFASKETGGKIVHSFNVSGKDKEEKTKNIIKLLCKAASQKTAIAGFAYQFAVAQGAWKK